MSARKLSLMGQQAMPTLHDDAHPEPPPVDRGLADRLRTAARRLSAEQPVAPTYACACAFAALHEAADAIDDVALTPSVERLDFTKPPPGYEVDLDDDQEVNPGLWTWSTDGGRTRGAEPQGADYEALEDAWSHYKGEHDPPGMETWNEAEGPPGGVWMVATLGESGYFADERSQDDARAAAWSCYETRLSHPNAD